MCLEAMILKEYLRFIRVNLPRTDHRTRKLHLLLPSLITTMKLTLVVSLITAGVVLASPAVRNDILSLFEIPFDISKQFVPKMSSRTVIENGIQIEKRCQECWCENFDPASCHCVEDGCCLVGGQKCE